VHEPDDFRADNPPANPALLQFLADELVAAQWDLRRIYRLILGSQTYQLAPLVPVPHPAAAANFASYPLRRLEAEVLIDAICQLTGTTEEYRSAIPEPATVMPAPEAKFRAPNVVKVLRVAPEPNCAEPATSSVAAGAEAPPPSPSAKSSPAFLAGHRMPFPA
jgi:hypothetical protein